MKCLLATFVVWGTSALAANWAPARSDWRQEEFVIGMWEGPCLTPNYDINDRNAVRQDSMAWQIAKDAYFNLVLKLPGSPPEATYRRMEYMLAIASKVGMKALVVGDSASCWDPAPWPGEPGRRWICVSCDPAYCEDGGGPRKPCHTCVPKHYRGLRPELRTAQYGYYLGDEPGESEAESIKNVLAAIKTTDPDKLGFFNLYPMHGRWKRPQYEAYLDLLVNDPDPTRRPDVVSFDHYPFVEGTRGDYFYSLRTAREKAGERPVWAVTLAGKYPHPDVNYAPSATEYRYMAHCPIAYGVKGLNAFLYFGMLAGPGCLETTGLYETVKEVNHHIRDVLGPMVMESEYLGTFHQSEAPTGEPLAPDELLATADAPLVADLGDPGMIVGVFKSRAVADRYYLFVVNKNLEARSDVRISLKGDLAGRITAAPRVLGFRAASDSISVHASHLAGAALTTLSASFVGGEGRAFRVDPAGLRSP